MVTPISNEARLNIIANDDQYDVRLAALAGGGYVAVWRSDNQNGSGAGLTAQLYTDLGERIGLPFFIEQSTTGDQVIGGVAGTADGGFVVTWSESSTGDVSARRFDASAAPTGDEFRVNTETYSTQHEPQVAGLAGGGFVVAWSSYNDTTYTYDIRAQRYDAAGATQGGEFTVNATTANTQSEPEIAALADGGFVVVWRDHSGADGASYGVFGQRYNAAGVAQGGEFQVNTTTANAQYEMSVAALNGGGFVVVWRDDSGADGSGSGVYGQRYDAAGAKLGGEFLVNVTTSNYQYEPAVAATADGGFFVSWNTYRSSNGDYYDIVGRHFDASGAAQGDEFVVSQEGNYGDPRRPDAIGLANGAIIVGWDHAAGDGDGSGRGAYQRLLQLDGSGLAAPTRPVLEAVDREIAFTESALQAGPQLLDASGAAAVSGPADFDGGRLTVSRVTALRDETQYNSVAGYADDLLGLRDQGNGPGEIGVAGAQVSFGGVVIGSIVSDGANRAALVIQFNANADRQAVEAVVENLTYANPSDDPAETVELALLLEDGDGAASEPVRVTVTVTPEADAPGPVFAGDLDVNSYTASTQNQPAVAELADGGWVVMWESYGQDNLNGDNYGIVGQRYDASGAQVGPEFLVNAQMLGNQRQVDVAGIDAGPNAGGFVAVWHDAQNYDEGYVRAQIFGADGQKVGGEIAVPTTVYHTQQHPSVAVFADGRFAVAWASYESATGSDDIKVQRFDASGAKLGAEIIANDFTASTQDFPDIVALAGGGFAVSWRSYSQGGTSDYEIASRVFDANGAAAAGETRVNTAEAGRQTLPQSAALTGGGYVVVWEDQNGLDGSGHGVFARIMDASGAPAGAQFLVNERTDNTQGEPVVTALPGGGFAVAFNSYANGYESYDVVMQRYDASGARIDGEIRINTATASSQYEPALATLGNGDVVAVWRDDSGRDGESDGIVMQVVGDPANYAGVTDNPVVSIAQQSVAMDEADVNAGPQLLFSGVDVSDADSADFDGGALSVFRAGAAQAQTPFAAPDNAAQDDLGLRNEGSGAGQIGVAGASVRFGGVEIGALVSDGADGSALTVALNANATAEAVEALLQNVTYANPSDDPADSRVFRVTLTDGDGGFAKPVNVTLTIAAEQDGIAPVAPELQVNSHERSNQTQPDVAALESGGYVTVWQSYNQDAGSSDFGVYAQRFNGDGQPVGDEIQVNQLTAGSQGEAKAAGLAAADGGGYVVVWQDGSLSVGYIKAQLHNDDGSVRLAEFRVETETYSTQATPSVAAVPGGFLVVWSSYNDETYTWDIRGQFFTGAGAARGAEFTVNTGETAGTQYYPAVAVDGAGNIVVVWEDQSGLDGENYGVFGQRIDANGAAVGAQFQVNDVSAGGQSQASLAYLADGRFIVAWYEGNGRDGSGGGVFARVFAADATPLGGGFQVNEAVSGTQQSPRVIALSDGGFAIGYEDSSGADGSGWGVFLQQYNADGSRRDGPVRVNEQTQSTQQQIALAEIAGGVAAAWMSSDSAPAGDGSGNGVFTRLLGQPGAAQPANATPELGDLDHIAYLDNSAPATPQVIDNAVTLNDADSADFDGGSVALRFVDHYATADDQLSVIAGKGITVSGANVLYDGVVIGAVDATDNGVNGADLVVNLNANADAGNVRYLLEQFGYASNSAAPATERSVSVRVRDGDGGVSEGDAVRLYLYATSPEMTLTDVDDAAATEAQVEAGLRLDAAVDFDYTHSDGFDGGSVTLSFYRGVTWRFGAAFETLFVANDGTGANQIGVSGSDITFEGVVIGAVDATENGADGANLRVNLLAAADARAVDALIEAFSYRNLSDGPAESVRFRVNVTDSGAQHSVNSRYFDLAITPEDDGALTPLGGEMQVNAFTEGAQNRPDIASLADGGFVVTWRSYNQDSASGYDYGVYQQRYSAAGEPAGPEIRVNETVNGSQNEPAIVGLAGGGWVTVWESNDASGSGVFARVFDANGVGGAEFLANVQTSSTQSQPSVTALANGGFVVGWTSQTSGGAGDGNGSGVIGRVFDASGAAQSVGDIVLNTVVASTQDQPDLAGLSGGGFVAVWRSYQNDGDGYGVAVQRFDNAGAKVGAETVVNATTAGTQSDAKVAALTDGGFVVVWESPDGYSEGVFMQRYDAAGAKVGGEVEVSDYRSSSQEQPDVVGLADGGWMVLWSDSSGRDGSGWAVMGQRYDAAGARVDGPVVINEETSSTQYGGVAAVLNDGRVATAWYSETAGAAGDGGGEGVFVRLFGEPAQASSADPVIDGLSDVTLDEAALNAGPVALFDAGAVSVADADSADFDGGRLMLHIVRDYAPAEQFRAPDDLTQDVFGFAGSGVSVSGNTVSVGGVAIGTLEQDGQSGAGLQVLLNANATAERIETLLGAVTYRNPSDDPRPTRSVEVTLSDGDGGVSDHKTFAIRITPEAEPAALQRVGGETQVNSFTVSTQDLSDVAGLTGGGHVVVWRSYNQDNPGDSDYGVFAQLHDRDGQPIGPEFQVNTTFVGSQTAPKVVGLADGGFVAAWSGNGVGDGNGSFAQRYDANGAAVGGEFRLNDDTASSDYDVDLAASSQGGFMAVWRSSADADIQARFYDASGAALGADVRVNATNQHTETQPAATALAGGGYAVVWRDATNGVVVRLFSAAGAAQGGEIQVDANFGGGDQVDPAIVALTGGGFAVAWSDHSGEDGSVYGVYAQIFSATGAAQGGRFLVNDYVDGYQYSPSLAPTADGGFVAVYQDDSRDGSSGGVFAQQFDASGNRIDAAIQVNSETLGGQDEPAAAALANGGVVVSWTSQTSGSAGDGSDDGVFSQLLGDPAVFNLEGRPVLQGVNDTVAYRENALNIGSQLLDANNAVAVSDSDSGDFDGGFIRVDIVTATRGYQDQVAPPDNYTQDNFGLRQAQGISIVGGDVFVDGAQVGTITQNGLAGAPFILSLNANASVAVVELLVENLTYRNTSDDPQESRVARVQIADGDGGVSDASLVTIDITPETDGAAPVFGERRANTETNSEQGASDVARLADGGFVIAWQSYDQDAASTHGVYAQRFDANGNAVGNEVLVNTTTAGNQDQPSVIGLADGGFAVTWRDASGADGSSYGVFMQRYAADGSAAGGQTQVNSYANSSQYQPDITMLANGDYVATWTSNGNTAAGGSGYDVFAQVYAANGSAIGSEFRVNTEVSSTQDEPSVTALANGGFAVAWTSRSSGSAGDGSGDGVFQRLYGDSVSGYAAQGGEAQVNSYTASTQDSPKIVGLVGGGHVAVWTSSGQDGSYEGVFAQRYDAAGQKVGQEFRVNDERSYIQHQPDIAALSHGGFVVVFSGYNGEDNSGFGVYAQQYAANGERIDGALLVNSETSSHQDEPSVAALDNGGFVVSWTSRTSGTAGDGSGDGVFYQVFSNTAPVVTDVSATTAEDANLVFDSQIFVDGYADAEGQALAEIRIDVLPSIGALELSGSPVAAGQVVTVAQLDAGALVYIPPADFSGAADFGWTGSDGASFAATIALTNITVTPVNDPVGLQPIPNQTIAEGASLNIAAQLADPDNDNYRVTVDYGEGDGPVSYNTASKTPNLSNYYEAEGVYAVSVTVDDRNGSVESVSFTVDVQNAAPIADDEYYSTDEDSAVAANIFIGDRDPGGDPFAITAINGQAYTPGDVFTLPSGATVTVSANGDLVYDPTVSTTLQALAGGQSGNDSFTYAITDNGGLSGAATVRVAVSGADDNVAAQDDAFSVDEDSAATGNVFADNGAGADIDPEGDALSVVSVNGSAALVGAPIAVSGGGVLQVNGDGGFSFNAAGQYDELAAGDSRVVAFSYIVQEAGSGLTASANGSVTITGVNDAPMAGDDVRGAAFETATTFSVTGNDSDRDAGDMLTVTSVGTPDDGTAALGANGQITYTPDAGFTGQDSFTYEVTDSQGATDVATVTVNVAGSNAPDARDDAFATDEMTAVNGNVLLDNGAGADSDPENDPFSVVAVNGQAAAVGSQVALVSGALVTLNADGTFSYDPNGGFAALAPGARATDSFSYTIADDNGGSDTAVVRVTVNGLNAAPSMANGAANAVEDGAAIAVNLAALGDDVDADDTGATLSYAVTTAPGAGSASVTGASLRFDPGADFQALNAGETRDVVIGVTATDRHGATSGEGAVTVTVTGVNDAPTLAAGALAAVEDGPAVTLDLATLGVDADGEDDGASLNYAIVGAPAEGSASVSGAALSFNPGADFQDLGAGETRDVTVTIQATDARGATSAARDVTVTVTGVNDAPTLAAGALAAVEDGPAVTLDLATLGVDADGEDDGASLNYAIVGAPAEGSASVSGAALSFNPGANFQDLGAGETRDVTVTIQATDARGATSATRDVTVTVTGLNDAPEAADDAYGASYETTLTVGAAAGVLANDADADGDALTATLVDGPSSGSLTLNPDGSFAYMPANGVSGPVSFTYRAGDGTALSDPASVVITVSPSGNRPPVARDDAREVDEDTILNSSVLGNDSDPDGDPLTPSLLDDPEHGVLMLNPNGTFSYSPDADFNGADSFTYTLSDGNGGTDTATVNIAVNPVNDDPVAEDDGFAAVAGATALAGDLLADNGSGVDSDVDGDPLSISAVNGQAASVGAQITLASGALLTVQAGGGFSYDQNGAFAGLAAGADATDSFTYTLSDGQGGTDDAVVTFAIDADSDGDGVGDSADNATFVFNPDQRDTDGDGRGNIVDPDFNNDGMVNIADAQVLAALFGRNDDYQAVQDADLNGDGTVNIADAQILARFYGDAPGHSYIDFA